MNQGTVQRTAPNSHQILTAESLSGRGGLLDSLAPSYDFQPEGAEVGSTQARKGVEGLSWDPGERPQARAPTCTCLPPPCTWAAASHTESGGPGPGGCTHRNTCSTTDWSGDFGQASEPLRSRREGHLTHRPAVGAKRLTNHLRARGDHQSVSAMVPLYWIECAQGREVQGMVGPRVPSLDFTEPLVLSFPGVP